MAVIAIVPARMASSRLPGKPLKHILGLPMIEHVRQRVRLSKNIDRVIIATCDKEILKVVQNYGGEVIMTSDKHNSCIDRVAEAAGKLDANIVVNVQGDMPLVDPSSLDTLVETMLKDTSIHFADMVAPVVELSLIHI